MTSSQRQPVNDKGCALRLGVMAGDGIGPEIVPHTLRVVDAALISCDCPAVEWVNLPLGSDAIEAHGTPSPQSTLDALGDLPGWILGPHDNASYPEPFRSRLSPGGTVRKTFGLYGNSRPARAFAGVRSMVPGMDLVVMRENSEGFYADRNMFVGSGEFMPTPDVALAVAVFTRPAIERIARAAFDLAARRRNLVTIVHKTNVLTLTTGLFRDVCLDVATEFPTVTVRQEHIDALAAHLVRSGADFDVIVAENMFGDILSDLTAELSGSLGMASSLNFSDTQAMAQAAHGAAPNIAGTDTANPVALMLSSAMLLEWLAIEKDEPRLGQAGSNIRLAIEATLDSGIQTTDIGGTASTSEFANAVLAQSKVIPA